MYVLFDIGGTNTRVAMSTDGKSIGEAVIFETPSQAEDGAKAIAEAVKGLGAPAAAAAAGGLPGTMDHERNILERSPNLPGWVGKPVKQLLADALGIPVLLENDAALVGLGEATHGAGKGFSIVEYITVSTGVGGARIVDGKIDERSIGFEPGHEFISFENHNPTTLEDTVSGAAIQKRFGKKPKEVTDPKVWEELAEMLAFGLHNTIVLWSPDVIVLGGPMITGNPAIPLDRIQFHLKQMLSIFPSMPVIKKAELANLGGLWGALQFIK